MHSPVLSVPVLKSLPVPTAATLIPGPPSIALRGLADFLSRMLHDMTGLS
jgi:hypothetical protein